MPKSWVSGILALGVGVGMGTAALAAPPELVSPLAVSGERCPTFSWSAVPGAAAYELVVYEVSAAEVGSHPLLSVRLPGGAGSWTPPGSSCLAAGGRYAWTLRVLGAEGTGAWSEPALFEVAAGPSLGELEAAIATLRRYLADSRRGEMNPGEGAAGEPQDLERPAGARGRSRTRPGRARARIGEAEVLRPETEKDLASVTAASVPTLGSASLTVDANVALGVGSNLFKDGSVFLWDDTTGNTALGRLALSSATGTADHNTAVGREALRYTAAGVDSGDGSYNTAVGDGALRSNTTGYWNTASGFRALFSNTTGFSNTASGYRALESNTTGFENTASGSYALSSNTTGYLNTASGRNALYNSTTGSGNTANGADALNSNTTGSYNTATGIGALTSNTTGSRNTAIGYGALVSNTTGSRNTGVGRSAGVGAMTGSDNIFLGYGASGVAGEANTIRIGGATGTGAGQQNRTFIAGILGITTANADAIGVLIDTAGQLGTVSSSREVKQDIREIGDLSRRLLELRPVAFRYRQHVAADPETPLQFGLLAEEVAEVMPELVVMNGEGRPETVKYHLLAALLLNELQRAERGLEDAQRELATERELNLCQQQALESYRGDLAHLRERLETLERGSGRRRPVRWRRRSAVGNGGPQKAPE